MSLVILQLCSAKRHRLPTRAEGPISSTEFDESPPDSAHGARRCLCFAKISSDATQVDLYLDTTGQQRGFRGHWKTMRA